MVNLFQHSTARRRDFCSRSLDLGCGAATSPTTSTFVRRACRPSSGVQVHRQSHRAFAWPRFWGLPSS